MHDRTSSGSPAAQLAARPPLRLGTLLVDPARRHVAGPGGAATLEPRVMQVLLRLADADGAVVTRAALIEDCWQGRFVGDDAVNRTISEVRRVARGPGAGSFAVETIPKTGWRLTEASFLSAPAADADPPPRPAMPPAASAPLRLSRRKMLAGGAAVFAVAGAGGWWLWSPSRRAADLFARAEAALAGGRFDHRAEAIRLFREGLALDPHNVRALGRLAVAQCLSVGDRTGDLPTAFAECNATVSAALLRDPDQPDARAAPALTGFDYGDWLAARRRMLAAAMLSPEVAEAGIALSSFELATGAMALAARRATDLGQRFPRRADVAANLAQALWFGGHFARLGPVVARPELKDHSARLWYLALTGRTAAALALVDAGFGMPPQLEAVLRATILALDTKRATDRARAVASCMAVAGRGHAGTYLPLLWLATLGATHEAFTVADGYYFGRGPVRVVYSDKLWVNSSRLEPHRRATAPLFMAQTASLRADPRFLPLVTEIGLVNYWRQAGIRPDFLGSRPLPA